MPILKNFLVKALNTFHVRTLCSKGFNTRVTLNNISEELDTNSQDFQVDVTLYDNEGNFIKYVSDKARIPKNSSVVIDCKEWQGADKKDRLIIFHMIPLNLNSQANNKSTVDIEKTEVFNFITSTDNYVEYYLENGYAAGLLYQCYPFNYQKFSKFSSTIIQAPKIFVNEEIDTLFSVFYSSPSNKLKVSKNLNCSITNPKGEVVYNWTERIKPYTCSLISLKNKIDAKLPNINFKDFQNFTFLGLSQDTSLVPFMIIHNKRHQTIAIEHSLPPSYYSDNIKGEIKKQIMSDLINSKLFEK